MLTHVNERRLRWRAHRPHQRRPTASSASKARAASPSLRRRFHARRHAARPHHPQRRSSHRAAGRFRRLRSRAWPMATIIRGLLVMKNWARWSRRGAGAAAGFGDDAARLARRARVTPDRRRPRRNAGASTMPASHACGGPVTPAYGANAAPAVTYTRSTLRPRMVVAERSSHRRTGRLVQAPPAAAPPATTPALPTESSTPWRCRFRRRLADRA